MARASERLGSALAQNGYEQIRTVGEGSFGKAILVQPTNPDDRSQSIVKMIDISRATRKDKEDALKESQVLSSLQHPNIVKYRNNFLAEGWLCIVMDYCEGGDLSSRIKKAKLRSKNFSEQQVLWWFTQGMQALKYIHDLHILHRDLKSANFFLSKSGNMKLGDFGISKVLDCTAACAQTQVGTPYYLCPEICKGKPYSWGSDVWAMGVVLYEMCALRVPFDAHDLKGLIQKITKAPTPELPNGYSRGLQDIVNKLLNREASLRPEAEEVLEMTLVRDTVKKMRKESSSQDRASEAGPQSVADSDANSARPQSVASSGAYSEFAGTFSKRDKVEYHSATHCEWLPATITDVNSKGSIRMDCKPNTWMPIEMQSDKVRPRQRQEEEPCDKTQRRPSSAGAPQKVAAPQPPQRRNSACPRPAGPPAPEPAPRRNSAAAAVGVRNQRPASGCRDAVGAGYRRSPRVAVA